MTILKRFLKHVSVQKENDCWPWVGGRDKDGYGRFFVKDWGGRIRAPRASYILFIGHLPDELNVLHTCDNPPCVNPKHLWLGTDRDNINDMVKKGRSLHGEKGTKTKLTSSEVQEIRKLYVNGLSSTRKLAKKFNVSRSAIQFILHNKHWTKI